MKFVKTMISSVRVGLIMGSNFSLEYKESYFKKILFLETNQPREAISLRKYRLFLENGTFDIFCLLCIYFNYFEQFVTCIKALISHVINLNH